MEQSRAAVGIVRHVHGHTHGARTAAHQRHAARIAAKPGDILGDPLQHQPLIAQRRIVGRSSVAGAGESGEAEAIVERDQHDVVVEQVLGAKVVGRAGEDVEAARVNVGDDGGGGGEIVGVDVQVEAVFGVRLGGVGRRTGGTGSSGQIVERGEIPGGFVGEGNLVHKMII